MAIRPFPILPGLLLTCAALAPAHAAELGDARVLSYIGQPLSAEVELTMVEDASKLVEAQLARADVYRGANIAMPPVLSGLDIAVIRKGGKQFLRLASVKPVEAKHLHVYLELIDGGQRAVRLVTLWLTPDPNPAPPPAPAPPVVLAPAAALAPAPAVVAVPAPARVAGAPPLRKPAPPERHPAPAALRDAPKQADLKTAASAKHGGKTVAAEHKPAEAPAPACAPAPSAAETHACAVLGAKNDALRQQLGHLEGKVKVLQMAAGVKPAVEAAAATVATPDVTPETAAQAHPGAQPEAHPGVPPETHPEPQPEAHAQAKLEAMPDAKPDAKPKSAPRIHRKPKPPAPPEEPTPWLAILGAIAGLLALAAGVVLLRRRRAAAGKVLQNAREPEVVVLPQDGAAGAAAKPGFMAAVKSRLMTVRLGKRPANAARIEPEVAQGTPVTQPE